MFGVKEFARRVGVKPATVYRYIKKGLIQPHITKTGRYKFDESHVREFLKLPPHEELVKDMKFAVIYARVSTREQQPYLEHQVDTLIDFALKNGYSVSFIFRDVASSFNFKRKGLNKLIESVLIDPPDAVIVYSRDRLSRIAFELFEQFFNHLGVKLIVASQEEQQDDLIDELVSFIHYITSKIYGQRRYKKKLMELKEKLSD